MSQWTYNSTRVWLLLKLLTQLRLRRIMVESIRIGYSKCVYFTRMTRKILCKSYWRVSTFIRIISFIFLFTCSYFSTQNRIIKGGVLFVVDSVIWSPLCCTRFEIFWSRGCVIGKMRWFLWYWVIGFRPVSPIYIGGFVWIPKVQLQGKRIDWHFFY